MENFIIIGVLAIIIFLGARTAIEKRGYDVIEIR